MVEGLNGAMGVTQDQRVQYTIERFAFHVERIQAMAVKYTRPMEQWWEAQAHAAALYIILDQDSDYLHSAVSALSRAFENGVTHDFTDAREAMRLRADNEATAHQGYSVIVSMLKLTSELTRLSSVRDNSDSAQAFSELCDKVMHHEFDPREYRNAVLYLEKEEVDKLLSPKIQAGWAVYSHPLSEHYAAEKAYPIAQLEADLRGLKNKL